MGKGGALSNGALFASLTKQVGGALPAWRAGGGCSAESTQFSPMWPGLESIGYFIGMRSLKHLCTRSN